MLPVVTYGTLLPDCPNYHNFLIGRTVAEIPVTVDGFDMYAGHSYGFPYVADGEGSIHGVLNYVNPEIYDRVIQELDMLEGFRGEGSGYNHYDRITVKVQVDGEIVDAYMYVIRDKTTLRSVLEMNKIESGSWMVHNYGKAPHSVLV